MTSADGNGTPAESAQAGRLELLAATWHRAVGFGPAQQQLLDQLLAHYREPHRAYHTVDHLAAVVEGATRLARKVRLGDDRTAVLAAFYHDAVYEPLRTDNEERSADLAVVELAGLGLPDALLDEVRALILATKGHQATTPAQEVLLDADLAILAAFPDDYDTYVDKVHREYVTNAGVSETAWRTGRRRVLEAFLAAPALFSTPPLRAREEAARANLRRELDRLNH